jgi:gp32 DNA binding protein like
MAIDIKKMREKLNKLNDKSGKGKTTQYWKPIENADSSIRIVPTEDGDPLKEYYFHYLRSEKKFQSVLCPKKNFGENCPMCDLVSKLYKEGDEESRKMAKDMSAKQRFFSPIVVRGEEEKGVQLWGYSKTIYEELLKLMLNPEYGDITDPDEGLDLVVSSSKKAGKMFAETSLTPKRKSSPLASRKELITEIVNHGTDFDNLFERKTASQVAEILDNFLKGGGDEGGDVSEPASSDDVEDLDSAMKSLGV